MANLSIAVRAERLANAVNALKQIRADQGGEGAWEDWYAAVLEDPNEQGHDEALDVESLLDFYA